MPKKAGYRIIILGYMVGHIAERTASFSRTAGARHPKFSTEKVSLTLERLIRFTHPKKLHRKHGSAHTSTILLICGTVFLVKGLGRGWVWEGDPCIV